MNGMMMGVNVSKKNIVVITTPFVVGCCCYVSNVTRGGLFVKFYLLL